MRNDKKAEVSFAGIEALTFDAAGMLVDAEEQCAALFETEGSEGLPVEPKP